MGQIEERQPPERSAGNWNATVPCNGKIKTNHAAEADVNAGPHETE